MQDFITKIFENNALLASIISAIVALFPILAAWLYKSRKYLWKAIEVVNALKEVAEFLDEVAKAANPDSPGGSKFTKEEIESIRAAGAEALDAIEDAGITKLLEKFNRGK